MLVTSGSDKVVRFWWVTFQRSEKHSGERMHLIGENAGI